MKRILVVRNDKLGDFILALPAIAMLKKSLPESEIIALVPSYTAELAKHCHYIDEVIVDAGKNAEKQDQQQTLATLKQQHLDAAIAFFSDRYNACLLWKAKIPYRLAPATKIIQFLYNHRLTQRRSRSEQPEFLYNIDLARKLLADQQVTAVEATCPYFDFSESTLIAQKQKLVKALSGLDLDKKWCFIHAGTGGSAKNLSLEQYARLAKIILAKFDCSIVLTAGKGEEIKATELACLIDDPRVVIYDKNQGLVDFATSIACCDLFIAGSTGPLHLAAALNKPTVGFFPSKRSACALRWQPVNSPEKQLLISANHAHSEEQQMQLIDIDALAADLEQFISRVWFADRP